VPVVAYNTTATAVSACLNIDITQLPSNGAGVSISGATTTLKRLNAKVHNPVDGCTTGAVLVSAGSTVNSCRVSEIRAAYGSNVFAVWNVGTLQELYVIDAEVGGTGSRVVSQQGVCGRIMMNDVRHTSGYRTFEQSAAANAGVTVMMSNVRVNSITNLAYFAKTAKLLTTNTEIQSGGAAAGIGVDGVGTTVTWQGDAVFNGVTESVLTNSGVLTKTTSVVV